jgi:hypothetical protein
MKKLPHLLTSAFLSTTLIACGGAGDTPPEEPAAIEEPVGTAGTATSAPQVDDPADAERAPAELPATASPLALFGALGALSLAGAIGVRRLRR